MDDNRRLRLNAMSRKGLDTSAVMVYLFMLDNSKKGVYSLGTAYVGGTLGLSKTSVFRCLRQLKDAGMVSTIARFAGSNADYLIEGAR